MLKFAIQQRLAAFLGGLAVCLSGLTGCVSQMQMAEDMEGSSVGAPQADPLRWPQAAPDYVRAVEEGVVRDVPTVAIDLDGSATHLSFSGSGEMLYVLLDDGNRLAVIDVKSAAIVNQFDLPDSYFVVIPLPRDPLVTVAESETKPESHVLLLKRVDWETSNLAIHRVDVHTGKMVAGEASREHYVTDAVVTVFQDRQILIIADPRLPSLEAYFVSSEDWRENLQSAGKAYLPAGPAYRVADTPDDRLLLAVHTSSSKASISFFDGEGQVVGDVRERYELSSLAAIPIADPLGDGRRFIASVTEIGVLTLRSVDVDRSLSFKRRSQSQYDSEVLDEIRFILDSKQAAIDYDRPNINLLYDKHTSSIFVSNISARKIPIVRLFTAGDPLKSAGELELDGFKNGGAVLSPDGSVIAIAEMGYGAVYLGDLNALHSVRE